MWTGVQTCALPICGRLGVAEFGNDLSEFLAQVEGREVGHLSFSLDSLRGPNRPRGLISLSDQLDFPDYLGRATLGTIPMTPPDFLPVNKAFLFRLARPTKKPDRVRRGFQSE